MSRDIVCKDGQSACIPWTGAVDRDGYPANRWHRKVLEAKLGRKLTRGEQARHSCDNPGCIEPSHLEPGTRLDNVRDREERDRTARGDSLPWAKLTAGQVENIAALTEMSAAELASVYGVTTKTIHDIWAGRRWNSVTGLPKVRKPIPYAQRGEIRRAS